MFYVLSYQNKRTDKEKTDTVFINIFL